MRILDASIRSLQLLLMICLIVILVLPGCGGGSGTTDTGSTNNTELEELGRALYFDTNLSNPPGQSCASCHLPDAGFDDPDNTLPTSEGAVAGRFGNRNSPTASYAAHIPAFTMVNGEFVGGLFLDGRADDLETQAQGPFLNPLEMNMADREAVVAVIRAASYAGDFEAVFGTGSLDNSDAAYVQISQAIAAFERTELFSPFTAKFDAVMAGNETFTPSEQRGFNLFVQGGNGGANCARCHSVNRNPVIFSNFQYENIGVPANPNNPFYLLDVSLNPDGLGFVDLGLGAAVNDANENGKFRVPTLRNIAETSPYMHNGVFQTLEEVVAFYNNRNPNDAEVIQNVTNNGVGNLNLSNVQMQDLVAFLQTLSDGFTP